MFDRISSSRQTREPFKSRYTTSVFLQLSSVGSVGNSVLHFVVPQNLLSIAEKNIRRRYVTRQGEQNDSNRIFRFRTVLLPRFDESKKKVVWIFDPRFSPVILLPKAYKFYSFSSLEKVNKQVSRKVTLDLYLKSDLFNATPLINGPVRSREIFSGGLWAMGNNFVE